MRPARALPALLALILPAARAEPVVNPVRAGHAPGFSLAFPDAAAAVLAFSSGDLAPVFPLACSENLVNWSVRGSVFTNAPAWVRGDLRDPRLFRTTAGWGLVYSARPRESTARRLGFATADTPEGPWTDRGEIDTGAGSATEPAVAADGETVHLFWNSGEGLRTAPFSPGRVRLTGAPAALELPRATAPAHPVAWRAGGRCFLAWADTGGDGGREVSVARAARWEGPWTGHPGNPVLRSTERLRQPAPAAAGPGVFAYAAERAGGPGWTGREVCLAGLRMDEAGWPVLEAPGELPEGAWADDGAFEDKFSDLALRADWSWSLAFPPSFRLEDGRLRLAPGPDGGEARLLRPLTAPNAQLLAAVDLAASDEAAASGLGLWAGERDAAGLQVADGLVGLWVKRDGEFALLTEVDAPGRGLLFLRLTLADNGLLLGETSRNGHEWAPVGGPLTLPAAAWNRPVQVGLRALGGAVAYEMIRCKPPGR